MVMENTETKPRVGVGVMILRDGKVLLGKRKNAHGAGEYAFPGGHLEYMETFEECSIRETEEEAGIKIKNLRFLCVANMRLYKPRQYVHIGMICDWDSGEAELKEPEKCEGWDWYDLNNLPQPMSRMAQLAFDAYFKKEIYVDIP
jgi:8-oxo-dGTP diphosphatase